MGIAYLQHLKILPNLQRPESINLRQTVTVPAERDPFGQQRIVDVSFVPVERTPKEVLSRSIADSDLVWGDSGVIKLLDEFLYYFAHEYPYDGSLAVSIRDGGFVALADPESSRLVVLDPFEIGRNCTSSVQQSLNTVIMEFKRASSALREGRAEALFEPKASKIGGNSRRRKINHIN